MKRRYKKILRIGIIIGLCILGIVAIMYKLGGNIEGTISIKYENEYVDPSEISITCDDIDDGEGNVFPIRVSQTEEGLKYSVSGISDCGRYYVRFTIPGSCIKQIDLQDKDIQYAIGVFVHHEQLRTSKTNTEVEIKKEGNVYKAYFKSNHEYPNGNKEEISREMDLSKACAVEIGFGP